MYIDILFIINSKNENSILDHYALIIGEGYFQGLVSEVAKRIADYSRVAMTNSNN